CHASDEGRYRDRQRLRGSVAGCRPVQLRHHRREGETVPDGVDVPDRPPVPIRGCPASAQGRFFFLRLPRPPRSTLFPYTTLFRSMRPVLSPDGRWLVYATRYDAETGLRLRNLSSGDERWLVYPVQRDDQESRFTRDLLPGSSFTPDSRALVVSYGGKIWRVDVPSGQAAPIPFTVKVHQDLGPLVRFETRVDTGDVLVKQIRDASPSPDGRRLAFSALDKLYVMDLPAGTPRRVTSDGVHEQVPAWSPD